MAKIKEKIRIAQEIRQHKEVRQAELSVLTEKLKADIDRLIFSLKTVSVEIKDCEYESVQLEQKLLEIKNSIASLENRDIEHKQMIEDWRTKLWELNNVKEELNQDVTAEKVQLSAFEQNAASIEESISQFKNYASAIMEKQEGLTQEQNKLENQISAARGELDTIIGLRTQLVQQRKEMEIEYKNGYTKKLELITVAQKVDKDLKETRRKHSDLQSRLHEAEMLQAKYGYEITRCLDELREQYALTREEALKQYRDDEPAHLAKTAKDLATAIAELGPINPAAIEEYNKLKERRHFLQTQYDDLVGAKECLTSIINEIDSTMGSQFIESFKKINEYFGEIFSKMFGGGMAQIRLTEPDNLLNSGIDVIVKPPGKKLQNLVLLSGGERALTVIALLFSFLSYRPSPFVVVDEIDAPLDEANLRRFSSFLKSYSNNTQFIVVTHRKGTMEAADIMHGVTIEEAGVSRLVSVKFSEKAG